MFSGRYDTYQITAGQDLDGAGFLYKAVVVAGTIAADASAIGILVSKGKSGENVAVAVDGVVKAWVGSGGVTAGATVTVTTSGWLCAAGSTGVPVGKALATAASGDLFPVLVGFANASVAT